MQFGYGLSVWHYISFYHVLKFTYYMKSITFKMTFPPTTKYNDGLSVYHSPSLKPWSYNHIMYKKSQYFRNGPFTSLTLLTKPFHTLKPFKMAPFPPPTTRYCLGKLIKDSYYTPKASKIHLNTGLWGEGGGEINIF